MAKTLHYDFTDAARGLGAIKGPTLSLTRATTARMVDADGYLREVQDGEARFPGATFIANKNVHDSQDLTAAGWSSQNATPASDYATAPDGTTTATRLIDDSSTGSNLVDIFQTVTEVRNGSTMVSVYAKADQLDWMRLTIGSYGSNTIFAYFDLTNGVVGATLGGDNLDQGIIDDGDGWYRCWVATPNERDAVYTINFACADSDGDATVDLDGTSSILLWGAQIEDVSGAWDSENLCLRSEDFSTTWGPGSEADVDVNVAVAPDTTTTADRITDDAVGGSATNNYALQTLNSIGTRTRFVASVYLKADGLDWAAIRFVNYTGITVEQYYDLTNGVVGTPTADVESSGIIDDGNGWFRCWLIFSTATDDGGQWRIYPADGDGDRTVDRDGTSSIFAWGSQLEKAKPNQTSPGTYVATTTAAVTNYSPSTYIATTTAAVSSLSGSSDGLLVEEARTNICLQSEDFGTTWTKGQSVETTNQTTAPDGSLTADLITDDNATGTGNVYVEQNFTVATSTAYTMSCFFKADQLDWASIGVVSFTTPASSWAWFDLSNGVIGTTDAGLDDSGIEDYGNGWYRCWVSFTTDGADTSGNVRLQVADGDGAAGNTVDRDGTSSNFMWGAQLEAGSFPTSYIPTTTASVTRNKETITGSAASELNDTDGTFYVHGAVQYASSSSVVFAAISKDFDEEHRIGYASNLSDRAESYSLDTSAVSLGVLSNAAEVGDTPRIALGYAASDYQTYIDGSAATMSGSEASVPTGLDTINVGHGDFGNAQPNGHIKEIRYYNERLANSVLEDMSNGVFPVEDSGVEEQMGEFLSYSRPIVGTTAAGTGATYIVLSRYSELTNISVIANGTVTFTVDSTLDNILWDSSALTAINLQSDDSSRSDPASAFWVNEIASGSADANARVSAPIFGLRINITAGTGSVSYRIQQT